jgi:hypothetical protein
MIDFHVTSVDLHVQDDSLMEEGHVTLLFRLNVSPDCEPPDLADTDLKKVKWFARITARDETQGAKFPSRIGTLRCQTSATSQSCWLTLALAPRRFDALHSALVRGHKVAELTVTIPALEKGGSWEILANEEHDVESIEVTVPLVSISRGTPGA